MATHCSHLYLTQIKTSNQLFYYPINDKQVSWQNNPTLEEGNRVSILSPIAGG
jgi:hypothetical protein